MGTTIRDKLGLIGITSKLNTAIHDGKAFSIDVDGTIPLSSSISLLGRVQSKEVHFHILEGAFQKGDIRISLYETPTLTTDGTPLTTFRNMNRNFSDTGDMLLFGTPTFSSSGLKVSSSFSPLTGGGANTQPSSTGIAGGRVLKKNTDYLIVIENLDNSACSYGIHFIWSEYNESAI
jgi:hypothetical protein